MLGLPGKVRAREFQEEGRSRQEQLEQRQRGLKQLEMQFEPSIPRSLCGQHMGSALSAFNSLNFLSQTLLLWARVRCLPPHPHPHPPASSPRIQMSADLARDSHYVTRGGASDVSSLPCFPFC